MTKNYFNIHPLIHFYSGSPPVKHSQKKKTFPTAESCSLVINLFFMSHDSPQATVKSMTLLESASGKNKK